MTVVITLIWVLIHYGPEEEKRNASTGLPDISQVGRKRTAAGKDIERRGKTDAGNGARFNVKACAVHV